MKNAPKASAHFVLSTLIHHGDTEGRRKCFNYSVLPCLRG